MYASSESKSGLATLRHNRVVQSVISSLNMISSLNIE